MTTARHPWENEDGSTNTAGFLAAYAKDDNEFWRADQGHLRNVLDELIWEVDRLRTENSELEEAAKAFRDLTIRYRMGSTPSEALFKRLDVAGELLARREGVVRRGRAQPVGGDSRERAVLTPDEVDGDET